MLWAQARRALIGAHDAARAAPPTPSVLPPRSSLVGPTSRWRRRASSAEQTDQPDGAGVQMGPKWWVERSREPGRHEPRREDETPHDAGPAQPRRKGVRGQHGHTQHGRAHLGGEHVHDVQRSCPPVVSREPVGHMAGGDRSLSGPRHHGEPEGQRDDPADPAGPVNRGLQSPPAPWRWAPSGLR